MRRTGERVFAWLLRLYPKALRARYGDDLLEFFRQDRKHPKYGAGWLRPFRFWLARLRDLSSQAWTLRVRRSGLARTSTASAASSLSRLRMDLRYAWRSLWSSPSLTAAALGLLTLGIGASTAMFSVVDAVALRSLPFPNADRLVSVNETDLRAGGRPLPAALQNYLEWRARQTVCEEVGASAFAGRQTATGPGGVEDVSTVEVTASLFDLLRATGRLDNSLIMGLLSGDAARPPRFVAP